MDATSAVFPWKKAVWHVLACAALFVLCYVEPLLGFAAMFLLPLLACPAFARGDYSFALELTVIPSAAAILAGLPLAAALLMLLPCAFTLVAVGIARATRRDISVTTLWCIAAYLLAALALAAYLRSMLGGALFSGMAEYAVSRVQGSPWAGNFLYRLTLMGYLPMPAAYSSAVGLPIGDFLLLNPLLQHELVNMLRLRLHEDLAVLVPQALVQGALVLGLFTALLAEGARYARAGEPKAAPLFRTLHLTRREQRYMLALCVGIVLTSFTDSAFLSLLCTLMYAAFAGVYQLLGAAVMVYLMARNHPRRTALYGLLAAALYALFPLALFILGMADQFFRLRAAGAQPTEHQEED